MSRLGSGSLSVMWGVLVFALSVGPLAFPCLAQPSGSEGAESPPADVLFPLASGVDPQAATTLVALPWQRGPLGLSGEQVGRLRTLADRHLLEIREVREEVNALLEAIPTLDRPIDAREAYTLFSDVEAHEGEIRAMFSVAAAEMLAVLTPEQRESWDRLLDGAGCGRTGGGNVAPAGYGD